MDSNLKDAAFRKELLDVFTLEAKEWLRQVQAAFKELRERAESQPDSTLLDVIQQGMTNLGGTAATVELPGIEQAAYAILPVVESLRDQEEPLSSEQAAAIHAELERIASAIALLSGSSLEHAPAEQSDDADASTAPAGAVPGADRYASVDELRELQREIIQTLDSHRNLVDLVIERAGSENGSSGSQLHAPTITRVLRELEGLDEQFLAKLHEQMPQITDALSNLQAIAQTTPEATGAVERLIPLVVDLLEAARGVRAASIAQFLQGLQAFLGVVNSRGIGVVAGRLEAVEFRLGAVIPMAQQWVDLGRAERAAIERLIAM